MLDDLPREPRPQPDPMLSNRRIGTVWIWLAGIVALVLIVGILLAISSPLNSIAHDDSRRGPLPTGISTPPQAALPASRNTTSAPPQQNTPNVPTTTGNGAQ